jgi:two-component sensor histidine kinase
MIDSLKEDLLTANDTSKAIILNLIAREYRHYEPKYYLKYILDAKKLSEKINYKKGIAFSLFNLGLYTANSGDHKTALKYFDQSLALTRKFHFDEIQNMVLLVYGSSLSDLTGDLKAERVFYDSVLKSATLEKNYKLLADAQDRIACIYSAQGAYDSATVYDIKALKNAESVKDSAMMGRVMINLGLSESKHGDEAKAMEYYTSALLIATTIKNKMVATYSLLNIGCIWMDRKENKKAIDYFLKALKLAKELDYKTRVISLHMHLGYAFYELGDYNKAFDYYSYGYELAKKNKEILQTIRILNGIGRVFKQKKEYKEAILYLNKSLEANKHHAFKEELSKTYLFLSQAYSSQNDFKNAHRFYVLHKTVDSTIFNTQREILKNEITTKYNVEKSTKEILVLKKNNEIKDLQLSNNRLVIIAAITIAVLMAIIVLIFYNKFKNKRKANEEKDIMLREIHHRVKNNMQIILSILNLQARKTNDEKIINFLKESESRIQSMAIIHEKLYQSDNLASISFKEYISQLVEFNYKIFNIDKEKIKYIITSADIHLDMNTAVPLGLIINELVCNSLKHGFTMKETGIISIQLSKLQAKEYELIISDTGRGLPENFDIKKTGTLGLKLIQTLTRQIEGKMEILTNNGTVFTIHFKEIK